MKDKKQLCLKLFFYNIFEYLDLIGIVGLAFVVHVINRRLRQVEVYVEKISIRKKTGVYLTCMSLPSNDLW